MTDIQEIVSKFSGKDIRVIEENGDLWIPVVDIGNAVGYLADNLTRVIRNNEQMFDGFYRTTVTVARQNSPPISIICVNEQGFYMLLSKVDINRIQNQEVK